VNRYLKKINRIHKSEALKKSRFSRANLAIFAIIFAAIGGYLIYSSFATSGVLPAGVTLQQIDGGPNYFGRWSHTIPSDPSFFPIGVFGQYDLSSVQSNGMTRINGHKDAGINVEVNLGNGLRGTTGGTTDMDVIKNTPGMYAIGDPTQANLNTTYTNNYGSSLAGWVYQDEIDGHDCSDGSYTDYAFLHVGTPCTLGASGKADYNAVVAMSNTLRSMDSTRPVYQGYTHAFAVNWFPGGPMSRLVDSGDILGYDIYVMEINNTTYGGQLDTSHVWAAYQSVMAARTNAGFSKPVWPDIEASPVDTDDKTTFDGYQIKPEEIQALAWNYVIGGALGFTYFNHCFCTSTNQTTHDAINDANFTANRAAIKAVDARIKNLAPVINSPFANGYATASGGVNLMAKYQASSDKFYVFAAPKQLGSQSVNFTLAGSPTATVNVIDENRTLSAVNGHFTDTFADQNTIHVYEIANGPSGPPDTTPPTTNITAPIAGATVSGANVILSANASDNTGVAGVQFKVDGANVGTEDTASPYSISWNSTSVANGSHNITAVARDAAGNTTTSSTVAVTVSNAPDTSAPTVSLTAPVNASTVSGSSVAVSANASDNVGVVGVQFKLDGANLQTEDTSSPYSITWDTISVSNGTHTLTALARDAAGNATTSSSVSVTVSNTAANLTMGFTSIGNTTDSGNVGQLLTQQATLSTTATIQSLSFYVAASVGNLRLGVYDSTGTGGGPGAKVAESAEFTPTTGWNTVTTTAHPTLSAGTYWLAWTPSSNSLQFKFDGTGTFKSTSFTYAALPATHPSPSAAAQTGQWSFYASLTSGGTTGAKTGDINGDNSVNITDLSLLLSSYNQNVAQCVTNTTFKCDLSSPGDGVVNIFDLSILLSHYGT
jgi:hypothetical protein